MAEGTDADDERREVEARIQLDWPVPWQPVWGTEDGLQSRIGTWSVRGALAGATRLPQGALEGVLGTLASLATRFDRRRGAAAHEFLRQAFGELDATELERRTRLAWLHLLRVTVDTERFFRRVPPEETAAHHQLSCSDAAREVLRRKCGALMVTGHLGNWEAGIALAPWVGFRSVYGVARAAKNRSLSRVIQATRERRGIRMLNRKGAMRAAPEILAAGGVIGLVLDQRASGRALLAPFFGRLARCDRSAGVLLKRLKVPIVIGHCLMGARPLHYHTTYGEVLWPEEWAGAEVEAIAQRINQALERMILACPEQYVWIHDRYKDTPRELAPGAPARILRNQVGRIDPRSDP